MIFDMDDDILSDEELLNLTESDDEGQVRTRLMQCRWSFWSPGH
jgi:hypothetical protein